MKQRQEPLTIPDNRTYVDVDVPNKGAHHFRLPRLGQAVELLDLISDEDRKRAADVLGAGHTLRERMLVFAALEEKAARVVGELWYHPTLELEADRHDGAAIAEELHDAGYAPFEIYSLAVSLYEPLLQLIFPVTEAKDPEGFFDETPGAAGTPN
jgi:hypothetical protein